MVLVESKLSPQERRAVEHHSNGLTRTETAREMGISENHVKNLWQAARRKARRFLPPEQLRRIDVPEPAGSTIRFGSLSGMSV